VVGTYTRLLETYGPWPAWRPWIGVEAWVEGKAVELGVGVSAAQVAKSMLEELRAVAVPLELALGFVEGV
jgi:hypothetical protein